MKGCLPDSGEGKKEQTPAAAAGATSLLLGERISYICSVGNFARSITSSDAFQFAIAIVYAPFVLYVTKTYTHSWMEKLQMLPLCIIAVAAPMLWAIMI